MLQIRVEQHAMRLSYMQQRCAHVRKVLLNLDYLRDEQQGSLKECTAGIVKFLFTVCAAVATSASNSATWIT